MSESKKGKYYKVLTCYRCGKQIGGSHSSIYKCCEFCGHIPERLSDYHRFKSKFFEESDDTDGEATAIAGMVSILCLLFIIGIIVLFTQLSPR